MLCHSINESYVLLIAENCLEEVTLYLYTTFNAKIDANNYEHLCKQRQNQQPLKVCGKRRPEELVYKSNPM